MPHHAHAHHQHARNNHGARHAEHEVNKAETVVNVVYVTASPTFEGPIGGYKTMDGSDEVQTPTTEIPTTAAAPVESSSTPVNAAPAVLAQSSSDSSPSPSPSSSPSAAPQAASTSPTSPTSLAEPATSQQSIIQSSTKAAKTTKAKTDPSSSAAVASPSRDSGKADHSTHKTLSDTLVPTSSAGLSSSSLLQPTTSVPANAQSSASSSSSPAVSKSSSAGMSGGAIAGLIIGLLLAIGILAGLIFFCLRRRRNHRNEAYGRANDEKAGLGNRGATAGLGRSASVQTSMTSPTAPRLSLRPVTQFLPDIAAKRKSGNALAGANGQAHQGAFNAREADAEKAMVNNRISDPTNPFGNHAEMSEKLPVQGNADNLTNPFGNHAETDRQLTEPNVEPEVVPPAPLRIRTPTPDGKAAAEGAGVAAIGAAAAMTGGKENIPKPLNLSPNRAASPAMNGMPSPVGSDFSTTPVSPGTFANGPPPSNVHRIQLDFKPSMDDELELRAGQLVRLLHEYDDGWVNRFLPILKRQC